MVQPSNADILRKYATKAPSSRRAKFILSVRRMAPRCSVPPQVRKSVALLFGPNDASATAAAAIATVADAGSVDTDVLGSGPRRAASQAPAQAPAPATAATLALALTCVWGRC